MGGLEPPWTPTWICHSGYEPLPSQPTAQMKPTQKKFITINLTLRIYQRLRSEIQELLLLFKAVTSQEEFISKTEYVQKYECTPRPLDWRL